MSDNAKGFICYLIVGCVGLIGLLIVIHRYQPVVKLVPVQAPIPSAREIQQRLTDLDNPRYNPGKIDGKIGPDSIIAWDNYICDRYAKRAIEGE